MVDICPKANCATPHHKQGVRVFIDKVGEEGYRQQQYSHPKASEEPCSAVPRRPHTAYGRNLAGVYTDLPMPRGNLCLLRGPTRNGQSVWTEPSFLRQTFRSLWPFHNSLGTRSTNLIYWIIGFQGTCDLCCYCVLWPRFQTGIGSQEAPSLTRNRKVGS